MTDIFYDPKTPLAVRRGMSRWLPLWLVCGVSSCVHLDTAQKNGCVTNSDCVVSGQTCVANTCQVVPPPVPCQTHFDCDADHICVDNVCTTFAALTAATVQDALLAAACEGLLDVCGAATMQKTFGADSLNNCASREEPGPDNAAFGVLPTDPSLFDAKMAAACVYDFRRYVANGPTLHFGSFTGWPPVCARVLKNGTIGTGSDCLQAQAGCEAGLECAYGPTFTNDSLWDNYICVTAYGQLGADCVDDKGLVYADCDAPFYCDTQATHQCQPRLAANAPCAYNPTTCPNSTVEGCEIFVDPCVDGCLCSSTTNTCVVTPPICALGTL